MKRVFLTAFASSLLFMTGSDSVSADEKVAKEVSPAAVVKLFWHKVEKGDIDGVLSLFVFSEKTKALIPRQRATFAMWSTVMKKGTTTVNIGPEKVVGSSGIVLVTSREDKSEPRSDVMYLVRKDGEWRLLPYAVPGDSPANQLDAETAGTMVKLKEWARAEMREKN